MPSTGVVMLEPARCRDQHRIPVHVLGISTGSAPQRQADRSAMIRGREVNNGDFYRSTSQHYLYGSFFQMRETEDVYSVVVYTLADQYCCSASSVGRPVRWQT